MAFPGATFRLAGWRISSALRTLLVGSMILVIRVYQWTLRPFIGAQCRFEPSCSHYAIEALRVHGAVRGSMMAAGRVLRCNPWRAGGHDPVPCSPARSCREVTL